LGSFSQGLARVAIAFVLDFTLDCTEIGERGVAQGVPSLQLLGGVIWLKLP